MVSVTGYEHELERVLFELKVNKKPSFSESVEKNKSVKFQRRLNRYCKKKEKEQRTNPEGVSGEYGETGFFCGFCHQLPIDDYF